MWDPWIDIPLLLIGGWYTWKSIRIRRKPDRIWVFNNQKAVEIHMDVYKLERDIEIMMNMGSCPNEESIVLLSATVDLQMLRDKTRHFWWLRPWSPETLRWMKLLRRVQDARRDFERQINGDPE